MHDFEAHGHLFFFVLQMADLKCMKRVLRRMGYSTAADVIEVKGRIACELSSADELLLTEMMFNGMFNEMSPEQVIASSGMTLVLSSIFVPTKSEIFTLF